MKLTSTTLVSVDGVIADALSTRPKYVASTTLTDPQSADTTVLSGDVAAAIGEIKAKPGGELQVHQGTRLIADTGPDIALELVDSRAFPKGGMLQVYRPTGRPEYPAATAD